MSPGRTGAALPDLGGPQVWQRGGRDRGQVRCWVLMLKQHPRTLAGATHPERITGPGIQWVLNNYSKIGQVSKQIQLSRCPTPTAPGAQAGVKDSV